MRDVGGDRRLGVGGALGGRAPWVRDGGVGPRWAGRLMRWGVAGRRGGVGAHGLRGGREGLDRVHHGLGGHHGL